MTDDEARALELLTALFHRWAASGADVRRHLHDLGVAENGEPIPVYAGTSAEGRGSFRFEFMPLEAMQTLIAESRKIVDAAGIDYHATDTGETTPINFADLFPGIDPEAMADQVASAAMTVLLTSIRQKIADALEDAFDEGLAVGQATLYGVIAERYAKIVGDPAPPPVVIPPGELDALAKEAADKARARWIELLKRLPHIELPRARGRPEKVTRAVLLAAIANRKKEGAAVTPVDIGGDINADESTVRKALDRHKIELPAPE